MEEKKLSDGNESVMSVNWEDAEVIKSWYPYLNQDLARHCDVLPIVESTLLAPLSLN